MKILRVTAKNGIPYNVRLLRKDENYGRNFVLTHDEDEPLIEFYDATKSGRYSETKALGNFISRYYLSTLQKSDPDYGLALWGDFPEYVIESDLMLDIILWAEDQISHRE